MLVTNAIICSSGIPTCFYVETNVTARGHYCQDAICFQCPSGYYGFDGKTCIQCPTGTSSVEGSISCGTSLTFDHPGLQKAYIPSDVAKINVRLWGGGGADSTTDGTTVFGGSGSFTSCNISIPTTTTLYVLVGDGGSITVRGAEGLHNIRGIESCR